LHAQAACIYILHHSLNEQLLQFVFIEALSPAPASPPLRATRAATPRLAPAPPPSSPLPCRRRRGLPESARSPGRAAAGSFRLCALPFGRKGGTSESASRSRRRRRGSPDPVAQGVDPSFPSRIYGGHGCCGRRRPGLSAAAVKCDSGATLAKGGGECGRPMSPPPREGGAASWGRGTASGAVSWWRGGHWPCRTRCGAMVACIDGATAGGGGVRQRRLLATSEELRRVWQRPAAWRLCVAVAGGMAGPTGATQMATPGGRQSSGVSAAQRKEGDGGVLRAWLSWWCCWSGAPCVCSEGGCSRRKPCGGGVLGRRSPRWGHHPGVTPLLHSVSR
jgi:hypothetical protein